MDFQPGPVGLPAAVAGGSGGNGDVSAQRGQRPDLGGCLDQLRTPTDLRGPGLGEVKETPFFGGENGVSYELGA